MVTDFTNFMDMTPQELYEDWLSYITSRDPLLQDTSVATFNSILAEAIASEFWIYIQLLKQKVKDSNVLTAEGDALSAIVLPMLPGGRQSGTNATGSLRFSRHTPAPSDITIPIHTICAAIGDDGKLIEFQTTEAATLQAGETQAYAEAVALVAGTASNVSIGTISVIRTPIVGITSVTNDAPFTGGTDQESDAELRARALYTIWLPGKATVPLIEEHLAGVEGVREAHVQTLGQGDVLIIVDGNAQENAIKYMIEDNLAAGCTAPGVLGATLRPGEHTFQIGDCSGAPVWIRTLQFLTEDVTIPFAYVDTNGASKSGTITLPSGSPPGHAAKATLADPTSLATEIVSSDYADDLSFDIFMGKGAYPYLWVGPELQTVDIDLTLVQTDTPEANLLENVANSLIAALSAYKIGDQLEYADLVKYIYVDYETGRAFSGIDDISSFRITCKGDTITGFGQHIAIDSDERIEPGEIKVV